MSLKGLEYKNDQMFDAIEVLMDPLNEIITDEEFAKIAKEGGNKYSVFFKVVKLISSPKHRQTVKQVCATLDGVDTENVDISITSLIARGIKLREFYKTSGLKDLFSSQAQMND